MALSLLPACVMLRRMLSHMSGRLSSMIMQAVYSSICRPLVLYALYAAVVSVNQLLMAVRSDSVAAGAALSFLQCAQTREMSTFSWRFLMSVHSANASWVLDRRMASMASRSPKLR